MRALKGLVRLQAIVRGRAVRRRTVATLKRLQSYRERQSEVQDKIIPAREECYNDCEKLSSQPKKEFKEKELNVSEIPIEHPKQKQKELQVYKHLYLVP